MHLAACGAAELIASLAAQGCPLSVGLEADFDLLASPSSSSSGGSSSPEPAPAPAPHHPSTAQRAHTKVQRAIGALFRRGRPSQPPQQTGLAPATTATSPASIFSSVSRLSSTAGKAAGSASTEAAAAEVPASGVALPQGCERAFRKGATPLHIACYLGRPEAVAALLQAGAPADQPDAEGWTPLHYCTGQAPGLQLSHFAAPCREAAALLVRAGADCFASYPGCLGKPSPWPMALLCSNPVVADYVLERRWDATAAVCRAVLDILVEADAQQQGGASTGGSSSLAWRGSGSGDSDDGGGDSNGAAAALEETARAPAPGDSAQQRRPALLKVRLPASREECWCVVAGAAKYGHIAAWRAFKARAVGSTRLATPSFSLGLPHQADDPSQLWHLAAAGVDVAACAASWRSSYGGLGFAVERGHVLTAEALLDLGVPLRDEDIYSCLTALCPQPAALLLLLQRRGAAMATTPEVGVGSSGASAQPSISPSYSPSTPELSALPAFSRFGFSRQLALKVRGRYEYGAGSSVLFEDEPVSWHCPIHRLLERHLQLVGLAAGEKHGQQDQAPCWLRDFRRGAAQCLEVMAELGVEPLTYEPHLAPGAVLARPVSAQELSTYRDLLMDRSRFDLDGSNRYLWLAFERTPWQPQCHHRWPAAFRAAARTLLLAASKRAQARAGAAGTAGTAWRPGAEGNDDSLVPCSCSASLSERPLVPQHSVVVPAAQQGTPGAATCRERQCTQPPEEVQEASQACLASLPRELLLRIVKLAARPLSAWL